MATSSIFNAIVPEALTKDNCADWSSCVKNYLLGQDLWDIVDTESKPTENEATFNSWRKRDAMALHVIQISCGPDMLSRIRKINSAKEAWDSLDEMHKPKSQKFETETNDDYAPLLKAVATGDLNFFEHHRNEYVLEAPVSSDGTTVLHHAVIKERVKIVEELVQLMSKEGLKIQENRGRTALHYAVTCGFYEMVACMVEKEAELVSIADEKGVIPVGSACQSGNKDVTRYLYPRTPLEDLTSQNGINGATLLCYCITNNLFDIALELLRKCPRLAFASDAKGNTLIHLLSQMPSAFYCGKLLWELRITSCIYSCIYSLLGQLRGSLSNLLKLLGIKQIYDTKLIHTQASQLLRVICEELLPTLSPTGHEMDVLVPDALFRAVNHGIVEFVVEITKAAPYLLSILDTDHRSIFHCAIVSRQEKILSLVYGVDSHKKAALTALEDEFGNNMLHLAGMLAPSTRLHHIPGAALQMQREWQWFKEVERIVPPMCKEMRNSNGQKPRELFTEEHSELVKEGRKWMKQTASACAIVGGLMVTFTFTATLTPPGGYNQDTGFPILWDERLFTKFILDGAISFICGLTSILIFLGILTSRYAEEDFFRSLPIKMSFGIATVLISVAYMTVAFSDTLSLTAHGQMHTIFTPILVLSHLPIITVVLLQYPLIIRIVTYKRSIFDRKTECWYK